MRIALLPYRVAFGLVLGGFTLAQSHSCHAQISPVPPQIPGAKVLAPETPQDEPPENETPQAHDTRLRFIYATSDLRFFDLGPFLINGNGLDFVPTDPKQRTRYFQAMNRVLDPRIPVETIIPLCHHFHEQVRTLALAALFYRNDPHLLPYIAELQNDKTRTFPGYTTLSRNWLATDGAGPPPYKQTVGDIATAMVDFYLGRVRYDAAFGVTGNDSDFDTYWAKRKDRTFCASWFAVQMMRANHGSGVPITQYRTEVDAVRKQIEALSEADRDWTLLYLHGGWEVGELISEADALAAAKRRGPDALLAVLHQNSPTDDPDLQCQDGKGPYRRFASFILEHADQLLRPDMADDLLQCETDQGALLQQGKVSFVTTAWLLAAAQLQPQRAREIIKSALGRFGGQLPLILALATIGNPDDFDFIATWYLNSPYKTDSMDKESGFFKGLPRQNATRGTRQLVARLVQDPRFDTTPFSDVYSALELANAWSGKPLLPMQKFFEDAWIRKFDLPNAEAALKNAREILRQTSAQWGR